MKQRVDAQRQAQIQADIQTWTNQIVPAWSDKSLSSPIVIKLCARGIPPKVRGDAWSKMIGNNLSISKEVRRSEGWSVGTAKATYRTFAQLTAFAHRSSG